MKTDDKLKTLFSYQDFIKDSELINMKREAEDGGFRLLSDDELACASGGVIPIIFVSQFVSVATLEGVKTGKALDFSGDKVLIENIGWVDKKDIQ